MPRKILDTSVLIHIWKKHRSKSRGVVTADTAARWGNELREMYEPAFLVTPILIEFLAGARTSDDLHLFRAFLAVFESLDQTTVPSADWEQARRFAERIPRDGKPRHLGDCIIAAIARRFRCEVVSYDRGFAS